MLTNTKFVFPLFLFSLCFFFACQKEDIVETPTPAVPSIYAHMEGDFYTQRIGKNSYSYTSTFFNHSDTADIEIAFSSQNDTLHVLGYEFPIDSINQTSFYKLESNAYDPKEWKLNYYNNYDSIVLSYEVLCSAGSAPCYKVVYRGRKDSKDDREMNPTMYTLAVVYKDFDAQIDTQYTADLLVSTTLLNPYYASSSYEDRLEFLIGTNRLKFDSFCSYSKEHKTGNHGTSKKVIYQKNDSLYIDYYETDQGTIPPYTIDTIYYSFQGVKQ
jgi:hypothetical protein